MAIQTEGPHAFDSGQVNARLLVDADPVADDPQ